MKRSYMLLGAVVNIRKYMAVYVMQDNLSNNSLYIYKYLNCEYQRGSQKFGEECLNFLLNCIKDM